MALDNYTWSGSNGSPALFVSREKYFGDAFALSVDNTPGGLVGPWTVTPANGDVITKQRNGAFYFLLGPRLDPYQGYGDQSSWLSFQFFKQPAGGYLEFRVRPRFFSLFPASNFIEWELRGLSPVTGFQTIMTLRQNLANVLWPTQGMVVGVEYYVDGATQTPLSTDPDAPSLPTFNVAFRWGYNTLDPDDCEITSCIFFDTDEVSQFPGGTFLKTYTAAALFGGGMWDYLETLDQEFALGIHEAAASQPVYNGSQSRAAQALINAGVDIPIEVFQNMFAINAGVEGFTHATDGFSGVLEPTEPETWQVYAPVIGWNHKLIGTDELLVTLILEEWGPPDYDDFTVIPVLGDPATEEWEPVEAVLDSTIIEEDWES